MKKREIGKEIGQTLGVLGIIAAISVLMLLALYSRDYNLKFSNGRIRFVAEIAIPTATSLNLNTSDPGHVTMTTSTLGGVKGYQFRVSGNRLMFLAKSYQTTSTSHTEANLSKGKRLYVQVRAYKENESGRTVYGIWSGKQSCVVQ